jgi:hypothetical protein
MVLNVNDGSVGIGSAVREIAADSAGISIVQEVFGIVKRSLSEAERGRDAACGESGARKGAAALVPASTQKFGARSAPG